MRRTLLLAILLIPAWLVRGQDFSVGSFDYTILSDSQSVSVISYDGLLCGDVVIPDSVKNQGRAYAVAEISSLGINPGVTTLTIPRTVSSLSRSQFSGLSNLKAFFVDKENNWYSAENGLLFKVTLTNKLYDLYCIPEGMTDVKIPEGTVSTYYDVFSSQSNITRVSIPSTFEFYIFDKLDSSVELTISENNPWYKYHDNAVYSRSGRTLLYLWNNGRNYIEIPESVDTIGSFNASYNRPSLISQNASPVHLKFDYCDIFHNFIVKSKLIPLYYKDPTWKYRIDRLIGYDYLVDSIMYRDLGNDKVEVMQYIGSNDKLDIPSSILLANGQTKEVCRIGNQSFASGIHPMELTLPETVTAIGDSAFYNHHYLQSISLPSYLQSIGNKAFLYCWKTVSVYAKGKPVDISDETFNYDENLYVPLEYEQEYRADEKWNSFNIYVYDGILDNFVYEITSPTSVKITKYTGSGVSQMILPDEITINGKNYVVTELGDNLFRNYNLTKVLLPSQLKRIGNSTFYGNGLTEITLPTTIEEIGEYAFFNNSIGSITLPESLVTIGANAFSGISDIKVFTSKSEPISLGNKAALGNYPKIYISPASLIQSYGIAPVWNNLNLICGDTFVDGMGFKIIDGERACVLRYDGSQYTKLEIPSSVTFDGRQYNVTMIADSAFYGRVPEEVIIPASVDSIGMYALYKSYDWIKLKMLGATPPKAHETSFPFSLYSSGYSYWVNHIEVPNEGYNNYQTAKVWKDISTNYYTRQYEDFIVDGVVYEILSDSSVAISEIKEITNSSAPILQIPSSVSYEGKEFTVTVLGEKTSRNESNIEGCLLILPTTIDSIAAYPAGFDFVYLKATVPPTFKNSYNRMYIPAAAESNYRNSRLYNPIAYSFTFTWSDSTLYYRHSPDAFTLLRRYTKEDDYVIVRSYISLSGTNYSVTEIGNDAFPNGGKSLHIPSSVTSIGENCLDRFDCVTVSAATPPTCYDSYQYKSQLKNKLLLVWDCDRYAVADVWKYFGRILYAGNEVYGDFVITRKEDGTACITGYLGSDNVALLSIPDTVMYMPVTEISDSVFTNMTISELHLPQTLQRIGNYSFSKLKGLQKILIPEGVTAIGAYAFSACESLNDVIIPVSLMDIGTYAFASSEIQHFAVRAGNETFASPNDNLTTKDKKVLMHWSSTSKVISEGIEEIAPGALDGRYFDFLYLPLSMKQVYGGTFAGVKGLKSVFIYKTINELWDGQVSTDVTGEECAYASVDGVLFSADTTELVYFPYYRTAYSEYKDYEIPSKVKRIGMYAFSGSRFEALTLSDSISFIDLLAFTEYTYGDNECNAVYAINNSYYNMPTSYSDKNKKVSALYVMSDLPPSAYFESFTEHMYECSTVYVPAGTLENYKNAWPWMMFNNLVFTPLAEEDYQLLMAFHHEMNDGIGWNYSWRFGETAESTRVMHGMKMRDGHVVAFDLSNYGLSGSLSDKLFKLPAIETLNFADNRLDAKIDSLITGDEVVSTTLKTLNLQNNQMRGNIGVLTQALPNLTSLNVSHNRFTDVSPVLSSSISSLSLDYQKMDTTIAYQALRKATDENHKGVPSLLLYDSYNRNFSPYYRTFDLTSTRGYWSMKLDYENGEMTPSPYSGNYLYTLPNDTEFKLYADNYHSANVLMHFEPGDSNFDAEVDVVDLQLTVNYALTETVNRLLNFTAMDIQADEWVNVQDVVSLANILMDMDVEENTGSVKRQAPSITEDVVTSDATLTLEGGRLVLNTSRPVAAMDIVIDGVEQVNWLLSPNDYDFIVNNKDGRTHIVHYSMSGNVIPAGETVLAEANGNGMRIVSAKLVDKDATRISVTLASYNDDKTTGIAESSMSGGPSLHLSGSQLRLFTSQLVNNLHWKVYSMSGTLISQGQMSGVEPGEHIFATSLHGERQVIVNIVADGVSYSKIVTN